MAESLNARIDETIKTLKLLKKDLLQAIWHEASHEQIDMLIEQVQAGELYKRELENLLNKNGRA